MKWLVKKTMVSGEDVTIFPLKKPGFFLGVARVAPSDRLRSAEHTRGGSASEETYPAW